jgi:hypothetical protein
MNSSPYPKTQHPSGRLPEKATTAAGIKPEASAQEGKKGGPAPPIRNNKPIKMKQREEDRAAAGTDQ